MDITKRELLAVIIAGMIAALIEFIILRQFGVK